MGFWKRLIYANKTKYQEQIVDEVDGIIQSTEVPMTDPIARNHYVDSCIEQIDEAQKNIDTLSKEYELVTSYLTDMEEIEALPEPNREELREQANHILQLSMSHDSFQNNLGERMNESDYMRMSRMETEAVEGIKKLADAEDYQSKIKQDLKRIDGERHACEFRIRAAKSMMENTRGMAMICLVAVVLCIGMLLVLQFAFDMQTRIGYLLTAAATAGAITYIFVKHLDAKSEAEKNVRMRNKLILLQNKVKIRYVNNTNLLEYLKMKYGVSGAKELRVTWENYLEEKETRKLQKETEEQLYFANRELLRTLHQYQIKLPEIWTGQVIALVNPKEMVEVRHALIGRRQSLRKQLEYNRELAGKAQDIIKEVVKEYPQDREDILQKVCGKL